MQRGNVKADRQYDVSCIRALLQNPQAFGNKSWRVNRQKQNCSQPPLRSQSAFRDDSYLQHEGRDFDLITYLDGRQYS